MNAMARIADLAEQIRGVSYDKEDASSTPRPGFLPILRAGNITDEGIVFEDLVFVPADRISEKQKIRKNDVIIAASSGSLDVVGKAARALQDFDGGFGAFCKVLRPGPDIDPSYFAHFFRTPEYRRRVSSLAAGVSINNLKNEHLDEILIPLPPLPEQRRIAAILDKADELRAKRRAALKKLDELTQSIFLDMFGDPATNPKGWPMVQLSQCFELKNGVNFQSEQKGRGIPVVDVLNMYSDDIHVRTEGLYRVDLSLPEERLLRQGDLLFVRSSVKREGVAWPALFPGLNEPATYCGFLIRARSTRENSLFDNRYLIHFLRQPVVRARLIASSGKVAITNINQERLGMLSLLVPPMELQTAFGEHVRKVERIKAQEQAAHTELDALFTSLQHRAFRGEL
jgi:type I restriction enzyme S subunit